MTRRHHTNGTGSTDDEANSTAPGDEPDQKAPGDLPADVREEARRLTRLARAASDDREATAYREDRDERLAAYGYTARVRDDDTLVCYPAEWIEDGEVVLDRVENTDRGYELALSGAGDPDDWAAVERHNASVVEEIGTEYGDPHRGNVRAFADFMGNHYARPVESASAAELREFITEYYPRNVWLDEEARAVLESSLAYVFEITDRPFPLDTAD